MNKIDLEIARADNTEVGDIVRVIWNRESFDIESANNYDLLIRITEKSNKDIFGGIVLLSNHKAFPVGSSDSTWFYMNENWSKVFLYEKKNNNK